jgi:hypothetical protein
MGAYHIGMLPVCLHKITQKIQNNCIHPLLYTVEIIRPPSNHLTARYTTVAPNNTLMSLARC